MSRIARRVHQAGVYFVTAHTWRCGFRWPVWQPGFHDRFVRDEKEFRNFANYIKENPEKARLVERAAEYPWSSANGRFSLDPSKFDGLQGLKFEESRGANVAAKAATHKS